MKSIFTSLFFVLTIGFSFSQESILFEYNWKNTKTVINNVEYFPPVNTELPSIYAQFTWNNGERNFSTRVCNVATGRSSSAYDNNTITFFILAQTLGSCYTPINNDYESVYFGNFFGFNFAIGPFHTYQYELISIAAGYQLILTNPEGNKAYYNGEFLQIDDIVTMEKVGVSPNPFKEKITINSLEPTKNYQLQIFDTSGRLVFEKAISQTETTELELNNLSKGNYFLFLSDGNEKKNYKIIKE